MLRKIIGEILRESFLYKLTIKIIEKRMELNLYIKEGEQLKVLKVPIYVVKNLLRDRLSSSELDRINRFCEPTEKPKFFSAGSVVVDFSNKTARCFQAGLKIEYLEPTWDVKIEAMSLSNY